MKNKFPPFIVGMLTTALITGLSITALAATGAVSFNHSPIQFNGQQISAAGEDYALDNGCMAPSSITYTDEKGGGTTYLPARRIAELMGVGIGYDTATGAVTVSGEATPAPTTTPAPDTTVAAADYSDWTAEEEAAYQEFKGMWRVEPVSSDNQYVSLQCYDYDEVSHTYTDREDEVEAFLTSNTIEFVERCCARFDLELYQQYQKETVNYHFMRRGPWGWQDRYVSGTWVWGYKDFLGYSSPR